MSQNYCDRSSTEIPYPDAMYYFIGPGSRLFRSITHMQRSCRSTSQKYGKFVFEVFFSSYNHQRLAEKYFWFTQIQCHFYQIKENIKCGESFDRSLPGEYKILFIDFNIDLDIIKSINFFNSAKKGFVKKFMTLTGQFATKV